MAIKRRRSTRRSSGGIPIDLIDEKLQQVYNGVWEVIMDFDDNSLADEAADAARRAVRVILESAR